MSKKLIICLLFIFVILLLFFHNLLLPKKEIILNITYNTSANKIADMLYENELIWNKEMFLILTKITGASQKLKAGIYKLNTKMNIFQILNTIREGKIYAVKLTIPEGLTAEEIAELIEKNGLGKKEKFLNYVKKNKLEGYLFPATYLFEYEKNEEEIAKTMNSEFNKRFTEEFKNRLKELKMSLHQIVVLASIIEKEAKIDSEKKLISGVFHNRLKRNWKLEADPTVRYVLKKYNGKLTYQDLKVKSPYNTYLHIGLPPAPICNPGLESIKAALYPAKTDFLFFFADGKGTHIFSKSRASHINKQKKR